MGNAHVKPHPRTRNRKQVHWKAADRPAPPGKPQLISETEVKPDVITIRWTRPVSDGGSPISGFLVEHRRTGSPHWVRATPLLVPLPELTLSGLEPGWRYQFRVSAQNAVGISDPSDVSEPITVTLQRSAITAPRFTQELKDTVALENEKCEFVAHFLGQPAPKVCWFKDGFEIFSSRRIRILTEHDKSILTIHQSSLSDEGEIKCTATNRAGHVSSKARLAIEAPPSIRLPRQYEEGLLFELGETIRLKVSIAGRPTPLVFCSHNGESVQNNDRYEIEFKDKSFSLKIDKATRDDRGEYQIKAVNKLGEDSKSFLVTVTDKPSPPGKARVVMTLGRSVTLSWDIPEDDGGCKIGNYIVEYYRLGWDVWLKAATSRQLTTILGDLIEGSEYKFRVKAESPYGVSDPSEESEVIFIPDPKRGLVQPPRGRSQPRDVIQEVLTPVAVRRKKAPRSQSSSRVEETYKLKQSGIDYDIFGAGIPKRPERTKIKSPPKTPEKLSPIVTRKDVDMRVNKTVIFDRASMARDLAYGSPEIKIKKEMQLPVNNVSSSSEMSISPELRNGGNHAVYKVKIEKKPDELMVENRKSRSPSPEKLRAKSVKGHQANVSGSSEFMLVLCPDENNKDRQELFNFDENAVPPPLSLSAPELGMEPPQFFELKTSASSTELLHERAMIRFNQAAEAEEAELEKRRKSGDKRISIDVPRIQINSKDSDDIVGLERKHSLRRRYSGGGMTQQQAAWVLRRQSLKSPSELLEEVSQNNLVKSPLPSEVKREIMMNRQRSESEEMEEEEFEKIRAKMASLQSQSSFERKTISVAEEEKWLAEYEESMSESDTESSDDHTKYNFKDKIIARSDSEEDDVITAYRPLGALKIDPRPIDISEPFEILTKRKQPPDPNFVPKPILKKVDTSSASASPTMSPTTSPPMSPISKSAPKSSRSHSPRPDVVLQRNRSKSLAVPSLPPLISTSSNEEIDDLEATVIKPRSRSSSLIAQKELMQRDPPKLERPRPRTPLHSISQIAGISAIAAAGVVIPQKLLEKKTDAEEAKVVVDHYADIVRNYGQRRKSNTPVYTDRESLKNAAENLETPQIEELPAKTIGVTLNEDTRRENKSDTYKQDSVDTQPVIMKTETLYKQVSTSSFETQTEIPSKEMLRKERISNKEIATSEDITSTRRPITQNDLSRGRRVSNSPTKRTTTQSKSPGRRRRESKSPTRREVTQSKSPSRRRPSTKSPGRPENWSNIKPTESQKPRRKTSPSPMRKALATRKSKSPSPIPFAKRRPLLKEITTQTSGGFESFELEPYSRSWTSTPTEKLRQEELLAEAKIKVRSAVDYATDLAMFVIACWLYLFKNELLAIPVLLVMVYRQLKDEVSKRVPKWILRRWKKKDQENKKP